MTNAETPEMRSGTNHDPAMAYTEATSRACWAAATVPADCPDIALAVVEVGDGYSVLWWSDGVASDWHEYVPNRLVAERRQYLIDCVNADVFMGDLDDWLRERGAL